MVKVVGNNSDSRVMHYHYSIVVCVENCSIQEQIKPITNWKGHTVRVQNIISRWKIQVWMRALLTAMSDCHVWRPHYHSTPTEQETILKTMNIKSIANAKVTGTSTIQYFYKKKINKWYLNASAIQWQYPYIVVSKKKNPYNFPFMFFFYQSSYITCVNLSIV